MDFNEELLDVINQFSSQKMIYLGLGTADEGEINDDTNQEYPITLRKFRNIFEGVIFLLLVDPLYKNNHPKILVDETFRRNNFPNIQNVFENYYYDDIKKVVVVYFPIEFNYDIHLRLVYELIKHSINKKNMFIFDPTFASGCFDDRMINFFHENSKMIIDNSNFIRIGLYFMTLLLNDLSVDYGMNYGIQKMTSYKYNVFFEKKDELWIMPSIFTMKLENTLDKPNFIKQNIIQYYLYKFLRFNSILTIIFYLKSLIQNTDNIFGSNYVEPLSEIDVISNLETKSEVDKKKIMEDLQRKFKNIIMTSSENVLRLFSVKYKFNFVKLINDIINGTYTDYIYVLRIFVRLLKCELVQIFKEKITMLDKNLYLTIIFSKIIELMKNKTSYTYINNEFKDFIKDMLKNDVFNGFFDLSIINEIYSMINKFEFYDFYFDIDFINPCIDECKIIDKDLH